MRPLRSPWVWPILAAWVCLAVAEFCGLLAVSDHHGLAEEGLWPWAVSLLAFIVFWSVMVAAMMLPANIPILDAFIGLRTGGGGSFLATASFLAGYAAVWMMFGAAAFVGDTGIHSLTNQWHWLHERERLILSATLVVVGIFQLVPAKLRHLERCRRRAEQVAHRPDGSWAGALTQGLRYGRCEVSCCWGLMLLMMALGHGLLWMLLLGGVMFSEKHLSRGVMLARTAGVLLVLCGSIVGFGVPWWQ